MKSRHVSVTTLVGGWWRPWDKITTEYYYFFLSCDSLSLSSREVVKKLYWSNQKNAGAFFSDMLVTRLSVTDTRNSTTILMRKSFECRQIFYSKLLPKIQFYLKFSHFLKPNPSKFALSFNIQIVTFNNSFKLKEKGSRLLKLFTSNWGSKKIVFI